MFNILPRDFDPIPADWMTANEIDTFFFDRDSRDHDPESSMEDTLVFLCNRDLTGAATKTYSLDDQITAVALEVVLDRPLATVIPFPSRRQLFELAEELKAAA